MSQSASPKRRLLRSLYGRWLYWLDRQKGKKHYRHHADRLPDVKISFIADEDIQVHVKIIRHNYDVHYDRGERFRRTVTLFEVTGTLPPTVSDAVLVHYREPIYFPKLLPGQIDDNRQIQAVVNAFLDIKRAQLLIKTNEAG